MAIANCLIPLPGPYEVIDQLQPNLKEVKIFVIFSIYSSSEHRWQYSYVKKKMT